jgi:hypothetical protein
LKRTYDLDENVYRLKGKKIRVYGNLWYDEVLYGGKVFFRSIMEWVIMM